MAESAYVGAYWGPRAEPLNSCAVRLGNCLGRLRELSPAFGRWYRRGRTKAAATRMPISTEPQALAALLAAGQNRRDLGGEVIDELGFTASLWNGDGKNPSAVSVTCGARISVVSNSFVVDLPPAGLADGSIDSRFAQEIIAALVEAWEPDWATFTSHSLRRALQPLSPGDPVAGWATYLRDPGHVRPERLPPGARLEHVASGALVLLPQPLAEDSLELMEPEPRKP